MSLRNTMQKLNLTAGFLVAGVLAQFCWADKLELKNDGSLQGKVSQTKVDGMVALKTDDGVAILIEKNRVKKTVLTPPATVNYSQLMATATDTADFHREVRKKLLGGGMAKVGDAHLERIVELDPSDKSAWAALDFVFDERSGNWIREAERDHRQGMRYVVVKNERKKLTWDAAAIWTVKQERERQKYEVEKKLKLQLKAYFQNDRDSVAAAQFLESFNNPLGIEYIVECLMTDLKQGGNGNFYMNMLLRMPGLSATPALIDLTMNMDLGERNRGIIDLSLEALNRNELSRDFAVNRYCAELAVKPPAKEGISLAKFNSIVARIDRAGQNLQTVSSDVAVYPLINALVTSGKVTFTKGQSNSIDRQGNTSFSSGGTVYDTIHQNQDSVRLALSQLTGENFGFDIASWRRWYAVKYAKSNLDLRRIE